MDAGNRSKANVNQTQRTVTLHDRFILSSGDFIDSKDRLCILRSTTTGLLYGSKCLLVDIIPPLLTGFWDEPDRLFDQLILSISDKSSLDDLGKKHIFADIVLCPSHSTGPVDERNCSRIGVGRLDLCPASDELE